MDRISMVFRLQPRALNAALAVTLVAATSRPTVAAASLAAVDRRKPTQQEQRMFRSLRSEMDAAGEQGDWDAFLERAYDALEALPEHETSRGARSEVVGLVGEWKIDDRSDAQVKDSVGVLEAYTDQLHDAYGDAADELSENLEAKRYVDELHGRLDSGTPATVGPPTQESTQRHRSIGPDSENRLEPNRRRSTAMIATGGSLAGVGTVLVVVGGVFAGKWKNEAESYQRLSDQQQVCMCVSPTDEAASWNQWTDARAKALGFAIPGIVLVGVGVGVLVAGIKARKGSNLANLRAPSQPGVVWRF